MASPNQRSVQPAARSGLELPLEVDDSLSQAAVSTALISVFRGKFCDAILPNRKTSTFKKEEVIYDVGDNERTFFFLQDGFVKVGTITSDGHELIYDVRKAGDVVGELCASETRRPDRAVALEQTEAIAVPFEDVMEVVRRQPDLLARLVDVFCQTAQHGQCSRGSSLERLEQFPSYPPDVSTTDSANKSTGSAVPFPQRRRAKRLRMLLQRI